MFFHKIYRVVCVNKSLLYCSFVLDLTKNCIQNIMGKIAIIAGSGDLPYRIEAQLRSVSAPYEFISITEGSQFQIGQIGKILNYLKNTGVTDVVFCGAVKRPNFFKLKLDNVGRRWIRKLGCRVFLGDDALLKGVKQLLAHENINVISPQSILKSLLTPSGVLTQNKPNKREMEDIARGIFVLNSMAKADVGQAVVVQDGVVLGIEAAEGTKNLIARCKNLKLVRYGGVLVKMAKTGQDTDIDLPTIGDQTILECMDTGLSGIALSAKTSQIIDYERTINLADKYGLFIIGV